MYYPNPIPDDFYSGNDDTLPEIEGDHLREDYYAWEWGDALFVVIEPYWYSLTWPSEGYTYGGEGDNGTEPQGDRWDWTLGEDQYQWLKQTLEESDATFKFVFTHHVTGGVIPYGRGGIAAAPYFEWGGLNWDGTPGFATERPGWEAPIHQLMVDNGVDIFFHAHDHCFAKEELDGIVYQESPMPANTGPNNNGNYNFTGFCEDNPSWYPDADVLPNSGHLRVTVSPDVATVDYVRAYLPGGGTNGEISYSYTIPAETPTTILGGVNDDDVVNSTDALIILSSDVGLDTSQYCPMNCGDVNGDGYVNSTDALIILSYDVGMTVPYPVGQPGCPSSVTPAPGCTP
jgi:hypothetical protein